MGVQVVTGAMMTCSFGLTPAPLNVTPTGVMASGLPAATIMDMVPMENIPTYGLRNTPSNPQVAWAPAAALGVLTPMPCVPATVSPWAPGAVSVTISGMPALTNTCTCNCMWGGLISITQPGQFNVQAT